MLYFLYLGQKEYFEKRKAPNYLKCALFCSLSLRNGMMFNMRMKILLGYPLDYFIYDRRRQCYNFYLLYHDRNPSDQSHSDHLVPYHFN
jgi:hypothetical protein